MVKTRRFLAKRILGLLGYDIVQHQPKPFIRFLKSQNKSNLVGIEIGVRDGWGALELLENLDIKKLYLIDPYLAYSDYQESQEMKNYQKWISDKKGIAKKVLKKYKNKIVWIYDLSEKAISQIKEGVDFVYIDGNHQYEYVKKDVELYYPKLNIGGIIGGDDYFDSESSDKMNFGVVKAVNGFFKGKRIMFEDTDWWAVKNSIK